MSIIGRVLMVAAAVVSPGHVPAEAREVLGDELAEAINAPSDPELLGHIFKTAMKSPDLPNVFTYEPREFMRADEIAAEISADKDVHVDCATVVLEWLAERWDVDVDELVRFEHRPYTMIDVPDEDTP